MKLKKNKQLLIYKVLELVTFLTLLVWAAALLAENILPGFISSYLSFLRLIILLSVLVIISAFLGKKLEIRHDLKFKKQPAILLAIFCFGIIALSLMKFHYAEIIVITTVSLLITYYLYKVFFEK